jgi:hypothetical protein
MIKTLTIVIIVILLGIGGWNLYEYWMKVSDESRLTQQQADQAKLAVNFDPRSLPGLPEKLEGPLAIAQKRGAAGLSDWLKFYRKNIQDPRLAWIELDYCVVAATSDPVEAKRVFADVKERIAPTSPVYPRIQQLQKTFE